MTFARVPRSYGVPAALALLLLVGGCQTLSSLWPWGGPSDKSDDEKELKLEELPPDLLYSNGVDALRKESYSTAVKHFEAIQQNYPYSPWATNAQLMEGYTEYRRNNYTEAVKWASDVAARWTASDSAEALAVVNQARRLSKIEPTADEKFQEAAEMDYAKGTVAVEGRIQSVTCQKNKRMELALLSGGKTLNFWVGNNFGWGFSDTLWYGRDHFYACYHLDGMKAIIRYAPTTNPIDNILELRRLEVLDDLIPDEELPNAN